MCMNTYLSNEDTIIKYYLEKHTFKKNYWWAKVTSLLVLFDRLRLSTVGTALLSYFLISAARSVLRHRHLPSALKDTVTISSYSAVSSPNLPDQDQHRDQLLETEIETETKLSRLRPRQD